MKTVMAQGTFDVLHPGHLFYLRESKKHGDRLVVVVARDSRHPDRKLVFKEDERREMLEALEVVDKAILGSEDDIYETVREFDPEVITLGCDQSHSEQDVRKMAEEATGHDVEIVRIEEKEGYSSSDIKS